MEKRILTVNLTEGNCSFSLLETSLAGLNLALSLYKEYGEASFVIGASGSEYNQYTGCYPLSIVFKSPITKRVAYYFTPCSFGGCLVSKNIDAVVITGTSRRLSYLSINERGAELFMCEQLRFSDISDFYSIVSEDGQDKLLAIGKAGEREASLAAIFTSNALEVASSGAGAVWGHMNLKGILACGKGEKKTEHKKFDKQLKKSKIVREIKKDGSSAIVALADKAGWLPSDYFSGAYDPRAFHLEGEALRAKYSAVAISCSACPIACHRQTKEGEILPDYEELMALGANSGWYSLDKVEGLAKACYKAGLSKRETGELIAYLRNNADEKIDIKGLSYDKTLHLIKLIGEKKGIGEELAKGFEAFPSALSYGNLPCLYDPRGALSLAVFSSRGEGELPYVDMLLSLSRRLTDEQMGIVSAYLRVYTHALMALGIQPFLMVPLYFEKRVKYLVPTKRVIRALFDGFKLFGLKKKDLLPFGFASLETYDCLFGEDLSIPERFLSVLGEEGRSEAIKGASLKSAYRRELEKLKAQSVLKSS